MKPIYPLSRRDFLKWAGLGSLALSISSLPHFTGKSLAQSETNPDLELRLRAIETEVSILEGSLTRVWSYQGEVLAGDPNALQTIPNSYLGPIIRLRQGQHVRIHFVNELPEESIIHWHGLLLSEAMDAHPRFAIPSGETYSYDFIVRNRAGTYWYHPHTHGKTASQVYQGLAGLLIVSDEEETALGLPDGNYDLPLVIQDRSFDAENQQQYITGGSMTVMMSEMMGFLGDNILVNGHLDYELNLEARAYRLRLLNGSNFRILKLGWSDGSPLTVIATDGGLLDAAVQRPYLTLSPGERIDVWVDFSAYTLGTQLELRSLAFTGVEMGGTMMGGMEMPETSSLPHGQEFSILKINVSQEASTNLSLPERLASIERLQLADALNRDSARLFEIAMLNEAWTLNGRGFEMDAVAEDEIVQAGSLEVWEFANLVNGAPMGSMEGHDMSNMGTDAEVLTEDQMAHPMHIHGVQFQVLERLIDENFREGWESLSAGYVDDGWKDTVLLMPGERLKLLMRFGTDLGLFVFHCHNLEHEDLGLMRNYRVE
jgi:FtsP/CotA-like multicopper oxidase with cupredoxin domain